jgi:hypothetical protein
MVSGNVVRLGDIARLVRSKNAGPFWLTIDVFFSDDVGYAMAAGPDVVDAERVAALYDVEPTSVLIFRDAALRTIKISFPRPVGQGSAADRDLHAGQQFILLAEMRIDTETAPARISE